MRKTRLNFSFCWESATESAKDISIDGDLWDHSPYDSVEDELSYWGD